MFLVVLVLFVCFSPSNGSSNFFKTNFGLFGNEFDNRFGPFSESERLRLMDEAKKMFYHGYDNYMEHAFPSDELNPIYCTGRGPDYENPSNININDVLGDYALTLVDALDTIAIMGNNTEFKKAVQLVIDNVSFDKSNTVQVFEVTIRVLGALLSAHLLITDPRQPFGDLTPPDYDGELLSLSHDLAARLMPAFEDTATGLPHPRVNLRYGVPTDANDETCTSGAGSLLLEFGVLSRLLDDPVYEAAARRTVKTLWQYRSNVTGLLGNVINIQTGEWVGQMSGLGAGLDSYFEYLLKSFVLFGEESDLKMFNESYETIKFHMRRGRDHCNTGKGHPPIYVNVNMKTGDTMNNWIDALQAAWSGVQVLFGDLEEAICSHALFYTIWRKYGVLPERFNWNLKTPDILFYPLRPELVESTYLLYQATKNPFYLHVGKDILSNLNTYAKAQCGYATIHDVNKKDLEDRMESFFLSETCKYLYLLFDKDHHVNKEAGRYLFTTEGHLFRVDKMFRQKNFLQDYEQKPIKSNAAVHENIPAINPVVNARHNVTNCESIPTERQYFLPMKRSYLQQMEAAVGLV